MRTKRRHLALAVVLGLLLGAPTTGHAEDEDTKRARALTAKGTRLFENEDYAAAAAAFGQAYDIKPHYLVQCNIARCYEMMGKYGEAARRYRQCLDEGAGKSPQARQVHRALRGVEAKQKEQEQQEREKQQEQQEREKQQRPPVQAVQIDRPFFGLGFFGAGIDLKDVSSQVKFATGFGYHLSGTTSGPAVAFELHLGIRSSYTALEMGPMFLWDIPLMKTLPLYITPFALLGYAHFTERCHGSICVPARNGLTMQVGADVRLVLLRRLLLAVRPFCLDILPTANGDWVVGLRYDILFGAGVVF
jgi:tetratricopeptide (TPR) repeat protein